MFVHRTAVCGYLKLYTIFFTYYNQILNKFTLRIKEKSSYFLKNNMMSQNWKFHIHFSKLVSCQILSSVRFNANDTCIYAYDRLKNTISFYILFLILLTLIFIFLYENCMTNLVLCNQYLDPVVTIVWMN